MMIDACDPSDTIPPLLAPVVERSEPRGPRAWQVRLAALDAHECRMFAPTKKAAQEWVNANGKSWARHAGECCAQAGLLAFAPLAVETVSRWQDREPFDRNLDMGDHAPRGGNPTCGAPIVVRLGSHSDLARARLGWTEERWRVSLDQWSVDADRRRAAWDQAIRDMEAGNLSDSDLAALRTEPHTAPYLRLGWRLDDLRRDVAIGSGWSTTRDLAAYWTGERSRAHCWAHEAA